MKAILIAGGTGSRLSPSTRGVNKHLLPVFDKPLIYYSLSTLMLAGISNVRLIVRQVDKPAFTNLLGNGSEFGINIEYGVQDEPKGIPDTVKISQEFIGTDDFALALGDNLFFGSGLSGVLSTMARQSNGARILLKEVADPERFGVAWIDRQGSVRKLEEKPLSPTSSFAITGLYFFPSSAAEIASQLEPSKRGELEIVDLLRNYLDNNNLQSWSLPRGTMWLDTGTTESLMDAANFVRSFQALSGQLIGSPHEIAWRNGWINDDKLRTISQTMRSTYGSALAQLISG